MTTQSGVNDTSILSDDDAANAFLDRWQDADDNQPSGTDEGDTNEDAGKDDAGDEDATDLDLIEEIESEDDTDEGDDADADQNDEDDTPLATDDHAVTVTVDGVEQTVSVKDLKRLYGQEAALTRKSQEVAAARKVADADGERYMVAAQKLINKAEARFAPFAKIDWMVAQNKLSPDEFAALRAEAKDAYDDLQFLNTEAEGVIAEVHETKRAEIAEAAKEAITVLERDIPGWNQEVYNTVRAHAVSTGMDANTVGSILDPAALKLLHSAMKYDQLKAKAAAKKKPTTKKAGAPKRVVKPSGRHNPDMGKPTKGKDALDRLKTSGETDDAVAALMAGWQNSDD